MGEKKGYLRNRIVLSGIYRISWILLVFVSNLCIFLVYSLRLIDTAFKTKLNVSLKWAFASPILFLIQLTGIGLFKEDNWGADVRGYQSVDDYVSGMDGYNRRRHLRVRMKRLFSALQEGKIKLKYVSCWDYVKKPEYIELLKDHRRRFEDKKTMPRGDFWGFHGTCFGALPINLIEVYNDQGELMMLTSTIKVGRVQFSLQYAAAERFSRQDLWWLSFILGIVIGIENRAEIINAFQSYGDSKSFGGLKPIDFKDLFKVFMPSPHPENSISTVDDLYEACKRSRSFRAE